MNDRMAAPLLLSVALVAAGVFTLAPIREASAEQSGTFKGSWIVSGKRQVLDFTTGRDVFTFNLEGHVNLEDNVGKLSDFWSECVGLWDSETGANGRCVWRSLEGSEVYSMLTSKTKLGEGVPVEGEIVGGTGDAEGATGKYTFTWSTVDFNRDERVLSGHSKDLAGSYTIP